jgi:ribosomal protein S12 methylthiotransferase accessory factor
MRPAARHLNELNIADERPVAALIGLAPDAGSTVGRPARRRTENPACLAVGDMRCGFAKAANGCASSSNSTPPAAAPISCIETLLDMEDPDAYEAALVGLYGDETLDLATDLIDGEMRFFGLQSPGLNLEGCDLHQRLIKQYEKSATLLRSTLKNRQIHPGKRSCAK